MSVMDEAQEKVDELYNGLIKKVKSEESNDMIYELVELCTELITGYNEILDVKIPQEKEHMLQLLPSCDGELKTKVVKRITELFKLDGGASK